ncbi:20674_t:CDS:2 [Gigaspora margarita]|uniref:20674_t:CDS:1 n=1 Tax=Gigaspora margarita TaxID=4874 RepID=A0ABM8VWF2_GIGMA|nr:20674_t:CDS:2 [Gigaspora margarita]
MVASNFTVYFLPFRLPRTWHRNLFAKETKKDDKVADGICGVIELKEQLDHKSYWQAILEMVASNFTVYFLPFRLPRTWHRILFAKEMKKDDKVADGICGVIELKKQLDHKSYWQAILEMVAADVHVGDDVKVFGVLTDMIN